MGLTPQPFFRRAVSLQTLEQARTVVFAICAPSVSDKKSQSLKKRFVLPFRWTQRCCSQRQALGLQKHRSIPDSRSPRQTSNSSVLLGSDLNSVKSSLSIDLMDTGAGPRGNYRDNGNLGYDCYEQLYIPPASLLHPIHTTSLKFSGKAPGHAGSGRAVKLKHRFQSDLTVAGVFKHRWRSLCSF